MDHLEFKHALERLDRAIAQKHEEIAALEAQRAPLMQQYSSALAGPVDHLGRRLP